MKIFRFNVIFTVAYAFYNGGYLVFASKNYGTLQFHFFLLMFLFVIFIQVFIILTLYREKLKEVETLKRENLGNRIKQAMQ
jgi:uncharacterized membrane protein